MAASAKLPGAAKGDQIRHVLAEPAGAKLQAAIHRE
jgi:hypothetical protein